jgi:hypothetical protein
MSRKIDRLCDDLRTKLHGIDRRLEALKGTMPPRQRSRGI